MRPQRIIFLLALLVTTCAAFCQREVITFNSGWTFQWEDSPSVVSVSLPHSWNVDAYTDKDYRKGRGVYRKSFVVPGQMQGRSVWLKLDGASKSAAVSLDGKPVGCHKGGYTASMYRLVADNQRHELEVVVDNADENVPPISGDFTFFGGLYRDAWLVATGDVHFSTTDLSTHGVYVRPSDVSAKAANVNISCKLSNDGNAKQRVKVVSELYSPDGKLLASATKTVTLAPNAENISVGNSMSVATPQLWTPESPILYNVVVRVLAHDGKPIDEYTTHTAFRWYSFDGSNGFTLNGKPYKLRGMCRHQDQWPMGVALTDEQHRRDFRMMKDMGTNFIRIAHYPQDDALIELCDREGMLVWEEIPVIDIVPDNAAYADNAEHNLREMIRQHYNHPSVILWGYMNEILLKTMRQYKTEETLRPVLDRTLALARRLEAALDEETVGSAVSSAMAFHGSNDYNKFGLADITDVVGWNLYQGWYGSDMNDFERYLKEQNDKHPDHPMIVSEYGAGSDRRLHSLSPKAFDFSSEYQQLYLEHYLPVIEQTPYVSGATHWNFIDFASALRDESMPRINNKGLVSNTRQPKDVYYYYKAAWRTDIPVVHIASRDWQYRSAAPGTSLPVKVYTNCSEVEMFVDGKSIGIQPVKNYTAIFDVTFGSSTEPVLRAIGKGGAEDGMRLHFTPVPLHTASLSPQDKIEIGINVGSQCFYTSEHSQFTWLPDQPYTEGSYGYIGGKEVQTQSEVKGTLEGPLHQTWREGADCYRFDVPDGMYEVETFITRNVEKGSEAAVYLLGKAGAQGGFIAERHRTTVKVTDGKLVISGISGDANISAIIVRNI